MNRPSLILVGHINFAPIAWVMARVVGARLIVFIYGIEVWDSLSVTRKLALRRADRIVSISRFTANRAARANLLSHDEIRILHNCLPSQVQEQNLDGGKHTGPSLLTVGRMSMAEQYKGHKYVIRAMPALLKRFPQLIYHIVGDGDARPMLEDLASRLGVDQAVHFHGFVSEARLWQHYAEASLYVMPSRGEGFGFVFLEAMAHGTPVIGGTVDATPEVVADGKTGLLVNPTSVEEIVKAVSRLLKDNELRNRMGQLAVTHVAENFSYQLFEKRLFDFVSEFHESQT